MNRVTVVHLYPAELNIYGDSGNVLALRKRLQWRGYDVQVIGIEPGRPYDFADADIVVGGGGQDSGQLRVAHDLLTRGPALHAAIEDGLPLLAVCGLYQLLGQGFTTHTGQEMPGIGVFQAVTRGSTTRMTGNAVIDTPFGQIVGFENHSGDTILAPGQTPLGQVLQGYGNNARRQHEGAIHAHAIGTNLHGPVLPNNPALADHLILAALRRRHLATTLAPLDDRLATAAGAGSARRDSMVRTPPMPERVRTR